MILSLYNQTKGGQIYPEGAAKLGKMLFGSTDDVLNILEKVSAVCRSVSDPDRCELAFKRLSCARDTAKKYGLIAPQEMI